MAEHFSFFDAVLEEDGVTYDREYNAQQFTKYFGALVTTGVMKGMGNMLAVSANGSNMVTKINTGIAFVEGKYYENDSFKELTHDTETLGNSRIDRIVIRMDLATEARYVRAFIKKGVPSTNPVPPALTQIENFYEISLAQVKIIGGQTYITSDNVTDERGLSTLCPWASSKILPSFNDNTLAQHVENVVVHTPYTVATGTANNYSVTLDNVNEYFEGMSLSVKIPVTNTGSSSININGLGPKTIVDSKGVAIKSGTLVLTCVYTLRYNGVNFLLQGSGDGTGVSGTAVPADVLSGKTYGTAEGLTTGTMPNRSGSTQTGTRRAQASGYVDASFPAGYYDGATNTRVRLSDANFTAANIRSGISIFGLSGTLLEGTKMAKGSFTGPARGEDLTIRGLGFTPAVVLFKGSGGSNSASLVAVASRSASFNNIVASFNTNSDGSTAYERPATWYSDGVALTSAISSGWNGITIQWVAFG